MQKILVLILFLSAVLANAQSPPSDLLITYSKQEVSLNEIFSDLEEQYGIRFSYATKSIGQEKIAVDFQKETISEVLSYLLDDIAMEYKVVENNILVRKSKSYVETNDIAYKKTMHIKGKVTNSEASAQLNYATISITNTAIGTYTDDNGRFDIEIPSEYLDEKLTIQYVGFESAEYKISELEEEYLLVAMSESQYAIDKITIVNKEKPIKIGTSNNAMILNKGQISSSTSGVMGNDINRQLQLLPGVAAHDDNSADIKIRGSNSEETLMILDGMPIYNANHYFGIFSSVNTSYIDSVNLFKNTYPLQYGGRTAGLVELFSDDDQPQKTTGTVNIDLLTASTSLKIPMTKSSSFSIAARSTITDINNKQFNTANSGQNAEQLIKKSNDRAKNRNTDPTSKFYDVNTKYQWTKGGNNLKLSFFRSADVVKNEYSTQIENEIDDRLNWVVREDQKWSTNAGSLIWNSKINKRINWNTRTFFSQYKNDELIDIALDKKFNPSSSGPPPNNPEAINLQSKQDNNLMDIGIDSYMNYTSNNHSIKLGITSTHHTIDYLFRENNINRIQGKESFLEIGGYAAYEKQFNKKLNISVGLRSMYYTNIEEVQLSPRLSSSYQLSNKISFKAAYGLEQQVVRQLDYDYRNQPLQLWVASGANDIPVLTSSNLMIGSTLKFGFINFDIELYQKNKTGVLEYSVLMPFNPSNSSEQERQYSLFIGEGITRGMDLIVGSGYKTYDTYLSYTLSSSKQQFDEIFKNKLFPSENDRRHQLKWMNNLSTGKITWGLNAIYTSGLQYININNINPNGNIRDLDPNSIRQRLRPYHRVDVSSAYNFKVGTLQSSLALSVFNLFNTQNVKYIQSVSTEIEGNQIPTNSILGTESSLLNRTVNLGLKIDF